MDKIFHLFAALCTGFSTGFIYSMPLGPSGIESINRSITKGFKEGFKVSVGAVLSDVSYLLLINLGLLKLLNYDNRTEYLFWVISGLILIILGQLSMKNNPTSKFKFLKNNKLGGLITGYLLTSLNPLTPSLWLILSGTIISIWRKSGNLYYIIAIFSMILGSLCWFAILNTLACKGMKIFKKIPTTTPNLLKQILKYVLIILGFCFIAFGFYKLIF